MKMLFLHGLESKLNDEKRAMLEKYGDVSAPDLDYSNNSSIIKTLYDKYETEGFDAIVGSSMGGFTGFYLASQLGIPALLFNPALAYRSVVQDVPKQIQPFAQPLHIVLGKLDPIVKFSDTKDFLRQYNIEHDVTVRLRDDLEHRIPAPIFEQEIETFFQVLQKNELEGAK